MRKEKQFLLDEIQQGIEGSQALVIMRYAKLSANAANQFRAGVAKVGGEVEMVPKRVLVKGAAQAGLTLEKELLDGHIALIFAKGDAIELAKYVIEYGVTSEQTVSVIGGRFEGKLYSGADVEKLSKLPNMNEMRAQFLGTLEAPLAQTLATVEAILCSVLYCLDNKAKACGESCSEDKANACGESCADDQASASDDSQQ